MKARILIVTNGQLGRNPRPWKEAQALGEAGYEVTVLMVRNHAATETMEAAALQNAPFRREAIEVLPGFSAGPAELLLRRGTEWGARKLARWKALQSVHALGPAHWILRRARQLAADLTIVHNEVPHWVGTRLLAEGRRVAADIEDWHSEDLLPEDRRRRPLDLLRQVESTLLHRAAYTTTTSHALADGLYARYGGRRPVVITNAFALQRNCHRPPPAEAPAFFWFSQTLGPGRGLEAFFAAWARTTVPSRVVLLGEPTGSFLGELLRSLPEERRGAVQALPLVPPAELPALIARHDLGLALEDPRIVNRDLTITNKLLQYLNAGLAVVATETSGQREVLTRAPGAGWLVNFTEPSAAADSLDSILADRVELGRRQAGARQAAEATYSWEQEAPRLVALVGQALTEGRPAFPA